MFFFPILETLYVSVLTTSFQKFEYVWILNNETLLAGLY